MILSVPSTRDIKEIPFSSIGWAGDLNAVGVGLFGTYSGTSNAPETEGVCLSMQRPGGDVYQLFIGMIGHYSRIVGGSWK